jgi:hypothetical protein
MKMQTDSHFENLEVVNLFGPGIGPLTNGNKYYLDPVNGSDGNDGLSPKTAMKTLPAAYAMLTANQNDILFVFGGASSINLLTNFKWNKNFTHMIGVSARLHNGGRVRITHGFNNSVNTAYIFEMAARGCIFRNIHFQFGRGSANNLIGFALTYNGNACNEFDNCDFEGMLNATEAAAAYQVVQIGTGSQDNTFRKCRFGQWTVEASLASGYEVNFIGGGSGNAVTYFEDCTFMAASTSASHSFINAGVNLGGDSSMVLFKDCRFIQTMGANTLTVAIVPPTTGFVLLQGCVGRGITDYSTTGNAHVQVTMPATNEGGGISTNPA